MYVAVTSPHLQDRGVQLQKMFIEGVRDLQPADECEGGYVLTTVRDLGQLALEVTHVRFEVAALPHLDSKKVVVVLLSLPTRCVLGKERFAYLLKIIERCESRE